MTKYFSVLAHGLTAEEEKVLAASWQGYGWWHAMPNFWLLRDHKDAFTANQIRDALRGIAPNARVMVLDIEPKTWAGSGMTAQNRDWLKNYWPPEGK